MKIIFQGNSEIPMLFPLYNQFYLINQTANVHTYIPYLLISSFYTQCVSLFSSISVAGTKLKNTSPFSKQGAHVWLQIIQTKATARSGLKTHNPRLCKYPSFCTKMRVRNSKVRLLKVKKNIRLLMIINKLKLRMGE